MIHKLERLAIVSSNTIVSNWLTIIFGKVLYTGTISMQSEGGFNRFWDFNATVDIFIRQINSNRDKNRRLPKNGLKIKMVCHSLFKIV